MARATPHTRHVWVPKGARLFHREDPARSSPARPNGQLLSVVSAEVFRRKVVVGLVSDFCKVGTEARREYVRYETDYSRI
jgi:hypothetical protein